MNANSNILIADPLAGLRNYAAEIISSILPESGQVLEAATGPQVVEVFKRHHPKFVLLDVAMPVMNGIKAASEIWAADESVKILFWTQYHREVYVRDLGRIVPDEAIHGYLLKNQPDEKLRYAITSVLLHDNPYIDPEIRANSASPKHGNWLNDRDFETLQDLALGLSERAISRRRHISIRGVQCRVASLYAKLIPNRDRAAENELFNPRSRMLSEAIRRGLIEADVLASWETDLNQWLNSDEYA